MYERAHKNNLHYQCVKKYFQFHGPIHIERPSHIIRSVQFGAEQQAARYLRFEFSGIKQCKGIAAALVYPMNRACFVQDETQ